MMDKMMNIVRREAQRVLSQFSMPRAGIVSAYDPNNYAAKVFIQPEGYESGWLPIRTPWSGNGWGLFCPPTPGDEVEIQYQEGGKLAPYIALRAFGDQSRPLKVPSGEFWLVDKLGNSFKFTGGKVQINGNTEIDVTTPTLNITATTAVNVTTPTMTLNGNLVVSGTINATEDITDFYTSTGSSMAHFRTIYDEHTHGDVQNGGGTTTPPTPTL
jgi:phage baseplate assembly protein gpV